MSDASVTGTRPRVGGFVGQNAANGQSEQSTTTNCYVKNTTVKGSTNTGGFVGVQYSSIAKSWVEGGTVIAGGNNAAGFSAFLSNNIKIDNCYSTATVSGGIYSPVGGLVGITYSGSSITNSYASCGVTGTGSYVGGLVGNLVSGVSAINCISWNSDLPLAGASDGTLTNCYTKDATETGTVSSHAQELGWDTSIWDFTGDFPTLK